MISILIIALFGVGAKVYIDSRPCVANGTRICFDEETGLFTLEQGASLKLFLKSQQQKDWLLEQLKEDIEAYDLDLDILIMDEISAWDAMYTYDADIFYIQKQQAAMIFDELMVIDPLFLKDISFEGIDHFLDVINMDGFRFLPSTYQGLLFVANETLLSQLGIDVSLKDEKNRIIGLTDWEDLIELTQQWQEITPVINRKKITSVFPFTVSEPWQFYAFLTSSGWHMFKDLDVSKPDFFSIEFYHSLLFVKELFETNWDLTKQNQSEWRYEKALINMEAPFSLATEWMDWDAIATINKQVYSYSAFPSNQSNQLTPLVKVGGLVIKDNAYPSLSHKIFTLLSSKENTQILLDSTDLNLVIAHDQIKEYEMDDIRRQKALAYTYSISEPMLALEHDRSILGWDFYLQGHVHEVMLKVFNKELTIEKAQVELIEAYDLWYAQHNQNGDGNGQ